MDYLNFDLRLGDWERVSRTGIAEVLHSPAGEGERHSFLLELDIPGCIDRSQRSPSATADLGRKLAESVLSQETLTLWRESCQIARERDLGLRLRMHIDSWELARVPWELLYDPQRGDFLVFDPLVSLVRHIRLHATHPTLRQAESLKMLVVVASPIDQTQLDWERELSLLEGALEELTDSKALS